MNLGNPVPPGPAVPDPVGFPFPIPRTPNELDDEPEKEPDIPTFPVPDPPPDPPHAEG